MTTKNNRGFLLPIPRERLNILKEKRAEYWQRMNMPNGEWKSWHECDLSERHRTDPDFRLLYYKLVILSTILIANEKFENYRNTTKNATNVVDSFLIGIDLSTSLGEAISPDEFESAIEVIDRYVTGREQEP